jgi:general secretion pathway protein B
MSLILDALRKSEAERRRGQSPDLHGASMITPTPRRDRFRQWPILAGGALVLLAVALLLWPRARPDAAGAASEDSEDSAASAIDRTDGNASADRLAPSPALRSDLATPAAPEPRRAAPAASAHGATLPPAATPAAPAVAPTQAVAPPPHARNALAQPAPELPTPAPANPLASPPDQLPTLAALSPGERAALPALKLSVHVWNNDPAQRFAIVDGQRLVEGATIGGAVVGEIRRDGVVLELNGRRVLLPRP